MRIAMRLALLAALGGAAGSVARYLAVTAAATVFGTDFPWGTFGVNVLGSFAIGAIMATIALHFGGSNELRVLLVTGFLGGFTTFSAFSYELMQLIQRQAYVPAFAYASGSVVISLAAVFLGFAAIRAVSV
jgi:fluoride exporter